MHKNNKHAFTRREAHAECRLLQSLQVFAAITIRMSHDCSKMHQVMRNANHHARVFRVLVYDTTHWQQHTNQRHGGLNAARWHVHTTTYSIVV